MLNYGKTKLLEIFVATKVVAEKFVEDNLVDLMVLSRLITLTGAYLTLGMVSNEVMAANTATNTLGSWSKTFTSGTLKPLVETGMYLAYGVGVGSAGNGLWQFVKVSKDDQQASVGAASGWLLGGGALMGLGSIAETAMNTVGGSEGTVRDAPGLTP